MDEMAFFSKHAPKIGLSDIFAMATIGGAETLGVSGRLGTLTSGKSAEMAFMPVQAGSVSQVMDALVRSRLPSRRISSAPIRAGCRRDPLHAT
jgi:cytosine/adenosine deaminase-related metal-dependent hydrolase